MKHAPATEKDLEEINAPLEASELLVGKGPYNLGEKLGSDSFLLLKFLEGGKLAGFLEAELSAPEARINCFVLAKEFRGKDYGTGILKAALAELGELGIERVSLLVKSGNISAKALYEKAGFGFVGMLHSNETGESFEEMEAEIGQETPSYVC